MESPFRGNFDKAADPRSTGAKTGGSQREVALAKRQQFINAVFARPLRRGSRFLLLPSSTPLRTCTPSTAGCSAKDPMVVAFATASHAAPAPRMSAPTQSHAPTCARAARGRAGRAIFIIRTHGSSCCRVRIAHPGHKPSLFTAHERECRMLTALCPIDGARAPPLAPCSEGAARLPASVGSNSSHRVFECEVQSDPYT